MAREFKLTAKANDLKERAPKINIAPIEIYSNFDRKSETNSMSQDANFS